MTQSGARAKRLDMREANGGREQSAHHKRSEWQTFGIKYVKDEGTVEDEGSLLVLRKIEEEGTNVAVGGSLLLLGTIDECSGGSGSWQRGHTADNNGHALTRWRRHVTLRCRPYPPGHALGL